MKLLLFQDSRARILKCLQNLISTPEESAEHLLNEGKGRANDNLPVEGKKDISRLDAWRMCLASIQKELGQIDFWTTMREF